MKHLLIVFVIIFICASENTIAQEEPSTDFTTEINKYDLSVIWMADSLYWLYDDGSAKWEREEPVGFIGDNFQRFYMHIISAIKVKDKPGTYYLYGKTKIKNNICTFHGTVIVREAKVYNKSIPKYTQGSVVCSVEIYEDDKQPSSGKIKGILKSYFAIDKSGVLGYDGLEFAADGFCNNQFTGNWTSYKTGDSKKCHWGDYRIPDCGDLDINPRVFCVNKKYVQNGWESYMLRGQGDPDTIEKLEAWQEEARQWWKD